MNLKNGYWFWKKAIPPRLCDDIIQYGLRNKKERAITGDQGRDRDLVKNPLNVKEIKQLKKIRDCDVVWMNDNWIYKEIQPYVRSANSLAGWNFQWQQSEACQFTVYTKGQYYGWHQDSWQEAYKNPGALQGKTRKLSMTVSLSDQKEYSGGNLEFDFRAISKNKPWACKEINSKGSLVVFPSFVWHRVTPVTRGIRYSLVSWHTGDPFI
jgi:PKHD-type hydroxylase